MKTIDLIMLIDDNEMDNVYHQYVLRKAGVARDIVVMESGEAALTYLRNPQSALPNLIFLDINMPSMNGFEFVEAFGALQPVPPSLIIVMLTSSSSPEDQERARQQALIRSYLTKPLTGASVQEVVNEFF
jgi:CheY-like chemotaxis protein